MLPLCRARGVGVLPWSPLARGLLTGNRSRGGAYASARAETDDYGHRLYSTEPDFQVADRVAEVAAARGVPRAQIALAWLLRQPGVTAPIIGATKLAQLEQAVGAVELELSDVECAALEASYQPHRVLGHD
jgi:aryl-alcohol dehydrogenase (NADP+)